MTAVQKTIVLIASVLIIATILYPPFVKLGGDSTRVVPIESGWAWIGNIGVIREGVNMRIRFDILSLEIFGIIVLAGAGLLITKKK